MRLRSGAAPRSLVIEASYHPIPLPTGSRPSLYTYKGLTVLRSSTPNTGRRYAPYPTAHTSTNTAAQKLTAMGSGSGSSSAYGRSGYNSRNGGVDNGQSGSKNKGSGKEVPKGRSGYNRDDEGDDDDGGSSKKKKETPKRK